MTSTATSNQQGEFLVPPETVLEEPGASGAFDLGAQTGKPVVLVLRVAEIIEQESLLISVWGSADGQNWGDKALFQFPERFYRSLTPASLDLSQRPEVKYLQARWAVNRWGRGYPRPHFKISIEIQSLAAG